MPGPGSGRESAMKFYIKEWHDNTATLMTGIGQVVCRFSSIEDAEAACLEWVAAKRNIDRNAGQEEYYILRSA